MRERGASGGYHVGDARDTYGDEYQFVDQYRNIKFIKVKSGSSKAPLETRTRDCIYVTLGGKNQDTPKTVTYYDKKGKKRKQIDISGNAHRIGDVVIPTPHTHLDYMHDGKTRSLSEREKKTLDTILKTSIRRNAIGARCESGDLRKGSQRCGPFCCAEKRKIWGTDNPRNRENELVRG